MLGIRDKTPSAREESKNFRYKKAMSLWFNSLKSAAAEAVAGKGNSYGLMNQNTACFDKQAVFSYIVIGDSEN
ncbi:hypothetical protein NDK43_16290 [Neobacillus pocheonensis]|uniref:Uncharacterized protein n=1 Tax=Neobacillus pocheonensis TaxID=363869 RepID=A0ABT0WDN6_9BACI|nr:hypothetical protein [Neobacillus pocheonensis]